MIGCSMITLKMIATTQNEPKIDRSRMVWIVVRKQTARPAASVMMPSMPGSISLAIAVVAVSTFASWISSGVSVRPSFRSQRLALHLVVLEEALGHLDRV